ncbi:MAG: hypothetical protein K0S68_762 [Candidatus Saccharibacteria bacterium]|nr:hypothetical protein [Candidatus Saccharibacteria bacterium]
MKLAQRGLVVLFVVSSFLSAALIFLSEPYMGKLLLPPFGGSPGVWNTCMVFFQAMLLAGYAYAHWSVKRLGLKRQVWLHAALLLVPLLVLPLTLPSWAGQSSAPPSLQILAILALTVGMPFFILSTSGPLLQRWFAATSHPRAASPYFLYAAGNLGSFVALLAYPLVVEPSMSLKQQSLFWTVGYVIFIALTLVSIFAMRRTMRPVAAETKAEAAAPAITWSQRWRWLFYAFLPSSLMLGVTAHITTDVASVPLLWVIPLALYLLTFVIAFGAGDPAKRVQRTAPFAAAGLFGAITITTLSLPMPAILIAMYFLALLTLISLVAHGKLAATKPHPLRLTEFYLWVAVGGVLGGIFNSLLAPVIFNNIYEFPLALLLTVPLLVSIKSLRRPGSRQLAFALVPCLLYLATMGLVVLGKGNLGDPVAMLVIFGLAVMFMLYRARPIGYGIGMLALLVTPLLALAAQPALHIERTFYGVIKVKQAGDTRVLYHGVTQHGSQFTDAKRSLEPTTYYHRSGPLGDVLPACQRLTGCRDIGVVGLGVGTLAGYGREGDRITFYEIDPEIIRIAHNPRLFTYLTRTPADTKTIVGDGRLSLASSKEQYDLLVIDAFSSDAIPSHLLTREAVKVYMDRLGPSGQLALHISNRYLDLKPIVQAAARDAGLQAVVLKGGTRNGGALPSEWVVLARDKATVDSLEGWEPLSGPQIDPWTDDYSNILDALR